MLGLFVRNHALAAAKSGINVVVAYATAINDSKYINTGYSVHEQDGLKEIIYYYRKSSFLANLSLLIAWFKVLKYCIVSNGKPALIHAHILTRSGLFAFFLSKIYRVPYILTEHWSRYYSHNLSYKGFLRKHATQMVLNNASKVTVVSESLTAAMKSRGLKFNYEILSNVVDTDKFNISLSKNVSFTFVSITCFEEKSKNLRLLINAAEILQKEGFVFELLMIGDGTDKQEIVQYSENTGINVKFTGTLSYSQTAEVLKQSHCLVVSSNYETFGIVAYEALACGIPVISTDVADLKRIIDQNSGIIVPVKDVESMANAMKMILLNYTMYNPEKIRSKVIDICSVSSVSASLGRLYQQVME
jgi:glycosyltransferase involved in cell wall biosynthesis